MKSVRFLFVFVLSVVLIQAFTFAQNEKMDDEMMGDEKMNGDKMTDNDMIMMIDKDENGLAIEGYDPVAYFTDGNPVMGKAEFSYKWNDAEWHFANENHLQMFKENPAKYAPQYGGFCALGVADNHCGHSDPTAWKIVDGKLYLTTNEKVEMKWEKDIMGNVKKGDKNWMMLNKEK